MHYLEHDDSDARPRDATGSPRLRVVGVVCEECGHEATPGEARLEGWHSSQSDDRIVCGRCMALVSLDDTVLYWAPCGHLDENGAVLFHGSFCVDCDS